MPDYDEKKSAPTQKKKPGTPLRPIPPAPKTPGVVHRPAKSVPSIEDLVSPVGQVSLDGVDSATLIKIATIYVEAIYTNLDRALTKALAELREPPPPPDRPFAVYVLGKLAETLVGSLLGRVGHVLVDAMEARKTEADVQNQKPAVDGKQPAKSSDASIQAFKDQLKSITGAASGGAKNLVTRAPGSTRTMPKSDSSKDAANPASLLAEFSAAAQGKLVGNRADALTQLVLAGNMIQQAAPGELALVVNSLQQHSNTDALNKWFEHEIAMGWLNFSASISLGPRDENKSVMPNANEIGGSVSPEWFRGHVGFVEIEIDCPDEVRGMAGVTLGRVTVASIGPGAAKILREMNLPLSALPVYRRLWLGTNKLDRLADVVITPEHQREVNGNSSMLAALASGAAGGFHEITGEGRTEERERARLLAKQAGRRPTPASAEPGPLGPSLEKYPIDGGPTPAEDGRLGVLAAKSIFRNVNAQRGAEMLVELLRKATTSVISG
jgi:hypothetical protein